MTGHGHEHLIYLNETPSSIPKQLRLYEDNLEHSRVSRKVSLVEISFIHNHKHHCGQTDKS